MNADTLALAFLGTVLVVVTVAMAVLAYVGSPIPDPLAMIGTGSLGGLVGLLVPARQSPRHTP